MIPINMTVTVLEEAGFLQALMGLGLSHGLTSDQPVGDSLLTCQTEAKLKTRAAALATFDGGHNKFLESIQVWLDVRAPRYWWQEFDTYRIGVTKQSESTMHTLGKRLLNQNDFVEPIPMAILDKLNWLVDRYQACTRFKLAPEVVWRELKGLLPEGFLQRRVISTNYKALRGIYFQRRNHKLLEWQLFFKAVLDQVAHPHFITNERTAQNA